MATAWICRNSKETDLLGAAFFAIRQAVAERLAKKQGLEVSYYPDDNFVDMAVQGKLDQIASFVMELADLYGIGNLTVDLKDGESDLDKVKEIETGAYNVTALV